MSWNFQRSLPHRLQTVLAIFQRKAKILLLKKDISKATHISISLRAGLLHSGAETLGVQWRQLFVHLADAGLLLKQGPPQIFLEYRGYFEFISLILWEVLLVHTKFWLFVFMKSERRNLQISLWLHVWISGLSNCHQQVALVVVHLLVGVLLHRLQRHSFRVHKCFWGIWN